MDNFYMIYGLAREDFGYKVKESSLTKRYPLESIFPVGVSLSDSSIQDWKRNEKNSEGVSRITHALLNSEKSISRDVPGLLERCAQSTEAILKSKNLSRETI